MFNHFFYVCLHSFFHGAFSVMFIFGFIFAACSCFMLAVLFGVCGDFWAFIFEVLLCFCLCLLSCLMCFFCDFCLLSVLQCLPVLMFTSL